MQKHCKTGKTYAQRFRQRVARFIGLQANIPTGSHGRRCKGHDGCHDGRDDKETELWRNGEENITKIPTGLGIENHMRALVAFSILIGNAKKYNVLIEKHTMIA